MNITGNSLTVLMIVVCFACLYVAHCFILSARYKEILAEVKEGQEKGAEFSRYASLRHAAFKRRYTLFLFFYTRFNGAQ